MKLFSLRAASLFFGTLLVFFAASATAQDCGATTDDQLVTSILDRVKADSILSAQASHIVVGSVNRFVKLQGWTDSKRDFDRLFDVVAKTACVTAINVNNFEETPPPPTSPLRPQPGGGCAAGTKPCGDVCIPEADSCSIKSKSAN